MDMFRTKERRGTPSKAQTFFQSLLRDAASSCGLWKRPPRMSQISAKRKDLFFKTILEACPELSPYKKEVWAKLRACIQNRRKYIHDRDAGKRKLKSDRNMNNTCTSDGSTSTSTTSTSSSKAVNEEKDIKEGSTVVLYGKGQRVLGKAIYLQKRDDTYSEIIIQTLSKNIESDDNDCELQEAAEGHTSLCNALIKKKVIWKTIRLNMCIRKQVPAATKTSKPQALPKVKVRVRKRILPSFDDDESSTSTTSTSSDIESDGTTNSILSSAADLDIKPSPIQVMDDHSNKNPTRGYKKLKKSTDRPNNGSAKKFDSDNIESEKLCIYEWGGGNFYFGISYFEKCIGSTSSSTATKRRFKIINCVKPIASVDSNGFVQVLSPCASSLKLNFGDIQTDPDPCYKVYELADSLCEIDFEGKNVTLLGNKDATMKNIRRAINSYTDDQGDRFMK